MSTAVHKTSLGDEINSKAIQCTALTIKRPLKLIINQLFTKNISEYIFRNIYVYEFMNISKNVSVCLCI